MKKLKVDINSTIFLALASAFILALITFSFAQIKTLPSKYNPVFISGSSFSDSLKIEDWTMFAFNAQTANWQASPFQMDEINGKGEFLKESDGFLGTNDELLFMSNDAGDKASEAQWQTSFESNERIEIEISDPLNPEQKGWVYLFKTLANKQNPVGYFQYIPSSQNLSADTIQTKSYKLGHNLKGWTDFVSLSNNWKNDLIDRIKFHINGGGVFGLPAIYLTEDTLKFETEDFIVKPIRSFQKVKTKIFLQIPSFPPINKEDSFIISYYPYSTEIGAGFSVDKGLLLLLQIKNIRLSVDLDPNIKNMVFYSANNPNGFPIDGKPDSPNILLQDLKNINWVMASGSAGTVLALFNFPEVQNAQGKFIYHRDDLNGGTNEGTEDTGDRVSFGDIGLWLQGNALVPESSSLYVSFTTYYINESNKNADFGNRVVNELNNPLQVKITAQTKPTSVNNINSIPKEFILRNVSPNPFDPSKGKALFQFESPIGNRSKVFVIYNLLGQIVKKVNLDILNRRNDIFEFYWDGLNENGSFLPAGIYFYQLRIGEQIQTKKIVLL